MLISERIMQFNRELEFTGKLPKGISLMNPFAENPEVIPIASAFYNKYFADENERRLILGINPGRLGAGATGIPFTDPKRLMEFCEIPFSGIKTHEPSSVYVYKVLEAFGGVENFYSKFYISSICPLGFLIHQKGKITNYNYYDSKALEKSVRPFAIAMLKKQLEFNIRRDICYCFGTGKNFHFIEGINQEFGFFEKIVPLEHPRYVMQYKQSRMEEYIMKYLEAFSQ